jgi:hypothetical protein
MTELRDQPPACPAGAVRIDFYIVGIVFRLPRTIFRVGLDSAVVLLLYLIGIAGLVAIATA